MDSNILPTVETGTFNRKPQQACAKGTVDDARTPVPAVKRQHVILHREENSTPDTHFTQLWKTTVATSPSAKPIAAISHRAVCRDMRIDLQRFAMTLGRRPC